MTDLVRSRRKIKKIIKLTQQKEEEEIDRILRKWDSDRVQSESQDTSMLFTISPLEITIYFGNTKNGEACT